MKGTMLDLFKAAGYDDYKNFPIDEPVTPKNRIGIYTWENGKKLKEVTALFYKGEADGGYKITSSRGSFLATYNHMLYEPKAHKFTKVEDAYGKDFEALLDDGSIEKIKIEKINDKFSILDCSVEDTHCYFSAGLLSHNSFGSRAKALTEFCNKYNILCANYGTTVLWISQERANLNPMARLPTATGGEAINYYTSITCRITKTDDIKDATGDVCGIEMRVRNYKNKCSVPFRDANMKLYYNGGFDSNSEYIDFLLLLGMVKQAGAYFKFNHDGQDYSLQGRKKLQEWLDTHADVYDSWKKEIIEKISHHNEILDANNQATDENGNEISLDEAKKMGNAVDVADLASQALAAAAGAD